MLWRKNIYEKYFESLEDELKMNLEINYKDLAWDAAKALRSYVDSLKNYRMTGGKSVEPFIPGVQKKAPSPAQIERMEKKLAAYEKGMEGYHH